MELTRKEATRAPIVVLTKPVDCSVIVPGSELYAVASDESNSVRSVEFFLEQRSIGTVSSRPYTLLAPSSVGKQGISEIEARACDASGKCSSYKAPIVVSTSQDGVATIVEQCKAKFLTPDVTAHMIHTATCG